MNSIAYYYSSNILEELNDLIADMQAADSPLIRAVWPAFREKLDWLLWRQSLKYDFPDEKNYGYLANGLYRIQDDWKQYEQPMLFIKVVGKLDLTENVWTSP